MTFTQGEADGFTLTQLTQALLADYQYRLLEYPDPDALSLSEYADFLKGHTKEQLIELIEENEELTLEDFMSCYGY